MPAMINTGSNKTVTKCATWRTGRLAAVWTPNATTEDILQWNVRDTNDEISRGALQRINRTSVATNGLGLLASGTESVCKQCG